MDKKGQTALEYLLIIIVAIIIIIAVWYWYTTTKVESGYEGGLIMENFIKGDEYIRIDSPKQLGQMLMGGVA
ncbi:MAG: class III signal peptide-containing protein [Candidatus Altiarchaeota archaeon]|nr:class III signal peptide-containing protein [Candidatus Altiarchaeota archaeon]